ncbi:MAG: hypothetical protein M3Z66_07675 [Chloroflexota bacterium]|nr:hypothetical protein [Chloroflexota bacterium]
MKSVLLRAVAVVAMLVFQTSATWAAMPAWSPTGQLSGEGVCGLVLSPAFAVDGTAWAGGADGGLYVSHDAGATWHWRPVPESQLPACPLAVSPAFSEDHLVIAVTDQAYRSTDDGQTWLPLQLPVTPSVIAFSPAYAVDRTILAASDQGPIYLSVDGGLSWSQVADWQQKLPVAGHFILYDALIRADGSMYLATGDGVFRSLDRGRSWSWANAGLPESRDTDSASGITYSRVERVVSLAVAPSGEMLAALAAARRGWVYVSQDAGTMWTAPGRPLAVRPTSLALSSPDILLGTHEGGVLESADGGAAWRSLNAGLNDEDVAALAVASSGGTVLAGGAYDGVFRLDTRLGSWAPAFTGMPQTDTATALVASPNRTVYAGTISGVLRTTEAGTSWQGDERGLPGERSVSGFALIGFQGDGQIFVATASGVYRAGRQGWRQIGSTPMLGLAADAVAANGNTLAAGTENGLFYSSDGGVHWELFVAGDMYVSHIVFSPRYAHDRTLYALCNGRLERYRGRHGTIICDYAGVSPFVGFALSPDGLHILAATASALYQYDGKRWIERLETPLGAQPVIRYLSRNTVLLGMSSGLLESRDGGMHWLPLATPKDAGVAAIAKVSAKRLLISVYGARVWRYELP